MHPHRQKIILHIGHGKTGSSFIQSSLALSVGSLREAGIEYPELASVPFDRAQRGLFTNGNLGEAASFVATVTDAAQRHPEAIRLLFSSEYLFLHLATHGEALAKLQQSFDVTIVLFVREFVAHAISRYRHAVKREGMACGFAEYLGATYRQPEHVLRVLQAIEQAGCQAKVFNYSRHADHLLETFAAALGVPHNRFSLPPIARVNRSLDRSELALARRFNRVLGPCGRLVSDPLCEQLPLHPVGVPRISRRDFDALRASVTPWEARINHLLPHSERYCLEEPVVIEDLDALEQESLTFSSAQIDALAQSLGGEIKKLREQKQSREGQAPSKPGQLLSPPALAATIPATIPVSVRSPAVASEASGRQEIILHIGHSKTGSSFIQSSLALSVESLREAGIEYPELPSFPFAGAKQGAASSGNVGDAVGFADTVADVAGRHAEAKRLLFSSEYLFERIGEEGGLLATLQESFDVTVILFVRDFLAHAVSNYNQRSKTKLSFFSHVLYLGLYSHPKDVRRVMQAIEQAGCRAKIYNYSRHADHLLEIFATALGVGAGVLVVPPAARVNRSLDRAEFYLASRFNEVMGPSRELIAHPLCERLPQHSAGAPWIARSDYDAFRARMAPLEAMLNELLPEAERYGVEEPICIEEQDDASQGRLTFSTAQIDVLAESIGAEIMRLRQQVERVQKPPQPTPLESPPAAGRRSWWNRVVSAIRVKMHDPFVSRTLARSPLFNAQWYRSTYPDVQAVGIDPLQHYCKYGRRELRNPSAEFDARAYVGRYPEARESGLNPLYHYLQFGKKRGWEISRPGS
ncbi:MAG: hypothetical protein WCJ21_08145 [Planctomycetota bacterium]